METKWPLLLILLIVSLLVSQYIKAYLHRKEAEKKLLIAKYWARRNERLLWKKENHVTFQFYHPKYQELWMIELGAEALFLMYFCNGLPGRSKEEYDREKAEWDRENV